MHKIVSIFCRREALIEELVLIVDEVLVLLEAIFFSLKEFVKLT